MVIGQFCSFTKYLNAAKLIVVVCYGPAVCDDTHVNTRLLYCSNSTNITYNSLLDIYISTDIYIYIYIYIYICWYMARQIISTNDI